MYLSWDQKYAPKTLDEYIFQNKDFEAKIRQYVEQKSIPNLSLYGHRGTGKSTLVALLKKELEIEDVDFLALEGGTDGGIAEIRKKVLKHLDTMPIGDFKIVFIEEADSISHQAMKSLKNIINAPQYSHARFILTFNFEKKVSNEVKSRTHEYHFKNYDKTVLAEHAVKILRKEGVKLDDVDNLFQYIDAQYPDIRKILISLEDGAKDGILKPYEEIQDESTLTLIATALEAIADNNWIKYRDSFTALNETDFHKLYLDLYSYIVDIEKVKECTNLYKKCIVIINDYSVNNSNGYADPFLNFGACMCKLMLVIHND